MIVEIRERKWYIIKYIITWILSGASVSTSKIYAKRFVDPYLRYIYNMRIVNHYSHFKIMHNE